MEISGPAGTEKEINFVIKNEEDPTFFSTDIVSFKSSGDGQSYHIDDKANGPIEFFIKDSANSRHFLLNNNQQKQITVKINIPPEIDKNDYYYLFLAATESLSSIDGTVSINNQASLATPILIKIDDNTSLDSKASIVKFSPKNGIRIPFLGKNNYWSDSFEKINLDLIVQNEREHYLFVQGNINVRDILNRKRLYQLKPSRILAKSAKKINIYGSVKTGDDLDFGPKLFNRAVLTASLTISSTEQTLYSTITVYRLPLKAAAAISIIVLAIALFWIVRNKSLVAVQ